MKEKPKVSSSRPGLHAAGVSVGAGEKSPEARSLSQTTRDPARIKRNAGRKANDRCSASVRQTGANGQAGESSSLNVPLAGANANGKRNGRELPGENAAASDDATGTTHAGDAPSAAVCTGRDACAEVAANGFHACLREQDANDEESGTVDDRRLRASEDLRKNKKPRATQSAAKLKADETKPVRVYPPGIDEPLAFDAPEFVDEMHARVNLYEIVDDLLSATDLKVKQRACEYLLEMRYGRGAPASAEEPQRIDWELPKPKD